MFFPQLRALTVTANTIWISPKKNTPSSDFVWQLPSLDNLTHLHVIGHIRKSKYHQLSSYRTQFPNLTHIRLTGSNNLPSEFYPTYNKPSGIWQRMAALWHGAPLIEKWRYVCLCYSILLLTPRRATSKVLFPSISR